MQRVRLLAGLCTGKLSGTLSFESEYLLDVPRDWLVCDFLIVMRSARETVIYPISLHNKTIEITVYRCS